MAQTQTPPQTDQLVLCPYCGHAQYGGDRCQQCNGLFEPLSRKATQLAMGPWQIRDKTSPFRPGCSYDIIKRMAAAGRIKATTVLRGPTTRQFWSIARNVPGVAHLIGYCHECGSHVSPTSAKCGACSAVFTEPRERNTLGLTYKTDEEAKRGQEQLDAELRGESPPTPVKPAPPRTASKSDAARSTGSSDLLAEVLDLSGDPGRAAAPSVPAKGRPSGATLDFAPTPERQAAAPRPASAFDVEPTGPLPEAGGISPIIMILVALNIIALGAIVVFVLLNR